jgi:hypothetical protein
VAVAMTASWSGRTVMSYNAHVPPRVPVGRPVHAF